VVADLPQTDADRGMSERMCTSAGRARDSTRSHSGTALWEHARSGRLGRPQQRRTDTGRNPDAGKIVVCTMLSVDGYTEGPGGDVLAMPMDAAFAEHNTDRGSDGELVPVRGPPIAGALTYWPQQHDNPDASPLNHYIAMRYAEGIPITVVSDTLTADDTGPWRDQTTIVRRGTVTRPSRGCASRMGTP
jgi:hypothetical protein